MTARLIALDWGTSSFRAYLIGADGAVLDRRAAAAGILAVKDGRFDAAMEEVIGDWPVGLPVIASGMITSRQGWVEVPYVACPASVAGLAEGLVSRSSERGRALHFVPGMSCRSADGVPDVMRGEEVQVFGASGAGRELFVAPGTHSKWIDCEAGAITGFASYMTGEVFAVMRQHSILGRLMTQDGHDEAAFLRGAKAGLSEPQGLLHRLFSARTLGLFGEMREAALASYLSGLLLGSEVGHAAALRPKGISCSILASETLGRLYAQVLALAGLEPRPAAADIAVAGLVRIAKSKGLLP